MPASPTSRTDTGADRLMMGRSHPGLAIVAFFAAFLFAAIPFYFNTDDFVVVAPCLIACFSCSILVMRLVMGDLGPIKYILLAIAGCLCYVAGEQWHVVVLLAGGTLLCSYLIARLMGDFVPVVRGVKHWGAE